MFGQPCVDVDRPGRLRAREVDQEPAREHRGRLGRVRIDALLPFVRAFRAQRETLGRPEDADRLEVGGLEEHLGRPVRDLGLEPAHDRRQRDRPLAVGDHQVARKQLPQRTVESAQRLALVRTPDDDPPAGEQRPVERVERAAPHVHHVVRHVDHVGDRAHARQVESAAQPLRRRADRHVAKDACDVTRAAGKVLDEHVNGLGSRDQRVLRLGRAQLTVEQGSDLTRDADHGQQVRAVHRRRHVQHLVDDRQHVDERCPRLEAVRQQHDPGVVRPEADLVLGEDHSLRRLAAELPLLERPREARQASAGQPDRDGRADAEVPGTAHDLLRLGVSHVDPAELEPIGVRVWVGRQHPSDDEVREVVPLVRHAHVDHPLDLERGDRQPPRYGIRGRAGLDVLAQPGDRDTHG